MLKGILGALAPTLVKAATSANPMAGLALKLAARKLGMPESSSLEDIEEKVESEPEKIQVIQSVELELEKITANLEGFKLEVVDRQDARKHFSDDPFPKIFALICLTSFMAYIFLITMQPPEANDLALVNLLIGNFFGLISGISAYFYGSSHNGKEK